jgi:hypothetical protein
VKRNPFYWLTSLLILWGLAWSLSWPPAFCQTKPALNLKAASAVYRNIEKNYTVESDGSYTLITHVLITILNYKGKKDHADFKYPYNTSYQSVEIISAKTHTRDGKTIYVTDKEIHDINAPEDARAGIYSRQHLKVVNFPSVEPGATVEIKLKLQSRKGFWAMECFQLSDPIERKSVSITLPATAKLLSKLPTIKLEKGKKQGEKTITYRWEARDIPQYIPEPYAPSIENRRICLFLTSLPSWKAAAYFFRTCLPNPKFPGDGAQFKGKTPEELYISFMKQFIPYAIDFFHTALIFQRPEETLRKGYGSSPDLAILFYALLKMKGFSPSYIMANTGNVLLTPFKKIPLPTLFDDVMIRCDDKDYAFYTRDLPPGYTGIQDKLVLDLKKAVLVPAKSIYPNRTLSRYSFTPTDAFNLEGSFTIKMEGKQAIEARSWLRYKTPGELRIAASQILHDIDPLAQPMGKIQREGLNTLAAPVILKGNFSIPAQFPESGDFTFIPLDKPDLPMELEALLETRLGPFMVSKDFTMDDEERIVLPDGMKTRYLPSASRGTLKLMNWSLKINLSKNAIAVHRIIHLKRGILYPGTEEYQEFIGVVRHLYLPSNRLIVLEKIR